MAIQNFLGILNRMGGDGLLICLVVLGLLVFGCAQEISSETITTTMEELDSGLEIFDEIQKIYEVGDSSLEKGYSESLGEKDAFRINVRRRDYYVIVWGIVDGGAVVVFPRGRQLVFDEGDAALIDVDGDNRLDIELELEEVEDSYEGVGVVASVELEGETATMKGIEYVSGKRARFYIKKVVERELIPSGNYFELFDVSVMLAEEEIRTAMDLEAFITFENFGEGISEIDIVYSIVNEMGREVYRGVDSKVVQTEDRVVKDFGFLELPLGKYVLRTEIFYGQNQTGEAEQDFEIVGASFVDVLWDPLFFILVIVVLFFVIIFMKRFYRRWRDVK